jgi:hypothetical protein
MKGDNFHERTGINGRGRFVVRIHPEAKPSIVLTEGKAVAKIEKQVECRKLRRDSIRWLRSRMCPSGIWGPCGRDRCLFS